MNGQGTILVKERIRDTLARPTIGDRPISVNVVNSITGAINVASTIVSRNTPVREESTQPEPIPQPGPSSVVQPEEPALSSVTSPASSSVTSPAPALSPSLSPVPEGSHDHHFRSTFHSFRHNLKWKLPSGCAVEDILFREYFRADLPEHVRKSIRHWTVLANNDIMQHMFSSDDWKVIVAQVKPLPSLPDPIMELLRDLSTVCTRCSDLVFFTITNSRLQVTTTKDLYQKVSAMPLIDPEEEDPNAFNLNWLRSVFGDLCTRSLPYLHRYNTDLFSLTAYNSRFLSTAAGCMEGWFDAHIWHPIIDKSLVDVAEVVLNRYEPSL